MALCLLLILSVGLLSTFLIEGVDRIVMSVWVVVKVFELNVYAYLCVFRVCRGYGYGGYVPPVVGCC